jgi:two-component system, response regulator PdtaR
VILIVENECLIRMATAEAIRDFGFEVVEAANADAAIVILEGRSDIRVVFTDIHMPGSMDGATETAGRLSASLPLRAG